jgi:exodeoxyribonuclease V alpha subunit
MSTPWSPHGALAAALADRGAEPPAVPPFPADVVEAAAAQDVGAELVHLAWEIARLLPGATPAEGRALLLLALAVLAAERDGSTRVPLAPRGPLPRLLASLGARAEDQRAVRALLDDAAAGEPRMRPLFGGSESEPGDYRPLLIVGGHLYAHRLWRLERRVVVRLRELLAAPSAVEGSALDAALGDLRARPAHDRAGRPVQLTDEQEAAVRAALVGRLTAVTGGPGTGKTWIVAALLRVVARLGEPALDAIALAAPTGKAADRLQGSLRAALGSVADPAEADRRLLAGSPAASTLHRLLAYSPTGELFLRHERNPLAEQLVLVDESSMLDLALAERLLRSLPAGGRLVLLGDAQQLPSVEAGAVFRDLVQAAAASGRVARLTRSWRMDPGDPAGSAILSFARAIAAGEAAALPAAARGPAAAATGARAADVAPSLVVRGSSDELAFAGAELLPSPPATLSTFLARWWQRQLEALPAWPALVARTWTAHDGFVDAAETAELAALFAHHESSRLLTATRGWSGGTGVAALNEWFRAALVRALEPALPRWSRRDADQPLAGEPVLVTRNDYRRNLYNGDQGIVLTVAGEDGVPTAMAVLRGSFGAVAGRRANDGGASTPGADAGVAAAAFRAFPLAALRGNVEPAWASTVHKAQGSEHDSVALILPAVEARLLTRELLYTAVTRARRSVVLVGTPERLEQAIARAVERWSGIAEALTPGPAPAPAPSAAPKSAGRQQLALPFPD